MSWMVYVQVYVSMYHSTWAVQTAADHNECIITYNTLTTVQYTDIVLAAVLCSIAQVLAADTTMTPHLAHGKMLHNHLNSFIA